MHPLSVMPMEGTGVSPHDYSGMTVVHLELGTSN